MYIVIIKKDHQLPQKLWIEDFVWTMFSNLVALLKDKLHLTNFGKKRLQFTESQNEDKRRLSVVALNNSNIGKHIYECNVFFRTSIVYNVQVLCTSCSTRIALWNQSIRLPNVYYSAAKDWFSIEQIKLYIIYGNNIYS